MKAVLIIVLLICASKAEFNMSCSDNSKPSLTFVPSENNIDGRYKVVWCTEAKKSDIIWDLVLNYIPTNLSSCPHTVLPGLSHSSFRIPVTINLNCTLVCFSNYLDLVFTNTCYHIMTYLQNENSTISPDTKHSHIYIINNFTVQHFTKSESLIELDGYKDGLVFFKWHLGYVPATHYTIDMEDRITNESKKYKVSCSVGGTMMNSLSCWARAPPDRRYYLQLRHTAPWTASPSLFRRVTILSATFSVSTPDVAKASSSPAGEYTTAMGAAAVVLAVLVVLCVVRRRRVAAWQRRVRDRWLENTRKKPTEKPGARGDILLLYARDCAQLKRAAERLGALVHGATGRRVIDVYSGEATRLWAPAGDEWLRLMLARDDTRVLLLQSPAGALLAAHLADSRSGPALAAPLLGSLASWRRPHAGDALLSLALRQLTSAPHAEPYRKHYVANIRGLGADMAPGVTPQRRYLLPDAVTCLLRDLAPDLKFAPGQGDDTDLNDKPGPNTTPGDHRPGLELAPKLMSAPVLDLEPLLQQFTDAADAFADHVRDDPDYLADELLFK